MHKPDKVQLKSGGSKGAQRMRAPLGVQILSISCSFSENSAKLYVGTLLGELVPPPRGNPGSATEHTVQSIDFFLNYQQHKVDISGNQLFPYFFCHKFDRKKNYLII